MSTTQTVNARQTATGTTYLSFPTVEAALGSLSRRVFGLDLVIEPAPETPSTHTEPTYRDLLEGEVIRDGDEWRDQDGHWQKRASVNADEVLLLASTDRGPHAPHRRLVTPAAIAEPAPDAPTADELRAERDNWAETAAHHLTEAKRLEAEATRLHVHWHEAATEVTDLRAEVKRLISQRDTFKALAEGLTKKPAPAPVPVPEYRLLDEGEILQEGDEFQGSFGWVLTRYLDQGVQPGWRGFYRRKIATI